MRRENLLTSYRANDMMDTIIKPSKPNKPRMTTGVSSKPKSKEHTTVPRQRRYSLDIVSSKPIVCHSQKDKVADDRRFSQRRHSLCTSGKSKDKSLVSDQKQSEMKSILKSGVSSVCSSSITSSETESSVGSDDKHSSSNDIKCSYRLPKSTGTGKLRKSVSFREDVSSAKSARRRFSSPAMDLSSDYSWSASTLS